MPFLTSVMPKFINDLKKGLRSFYIGAGRWGVKEKERPWYRRNRVKFFPLNLIFADLKSNQCLGCRVKIAHSLEKYFRMRSERSAKLK
ncbi:hypothetical protein LEP1GSC050_0512 [Leptospira broomii serovar Hurstbridge str. 5399]|uniref:Uncharacterized protein n=1 Tax=Leptospira broomii serovar Hurstbridge str. 5399 TaxID=1049789 RepID=T0GMA6_9LEPT|nr:hypothetical protein LEP1GSC050_0512 [Leptospira broomii serovar Hurstbridge str. 5399]